MEALLAKIGPVLQVASYVLMALVIVATIVAKITPTPKDNKVVSTGATYILKFIKFLPTLGVNPSTKKLEEAYAKIQEKKEDVQNTPTS